MEKLRELVYRNPVRVQAFIMAGLLLIASYVADFPTEIVATLIFAALGLGEYGQRIENVKTIDALHEEPPTEE